VTLAPLARLVEVDQREAPGRREPTEPRVRLETPAQPVRVAHVDGPDGPVGPDRQVARVPLGGLAQQAAQERLVLEGGPG